MMTPTTGDKKGSKPKAEHQWRKHTEGRVYAKPADRSDDCFGVRVTLSRALADRASKELGSYFRIEGKLLERALERKGTFPQFDRSEAGQVTGRGCTVAKAAYEALLRKEKAESEFFIDGALNALLAAELQKPTAVRGPEGRAPKGKAPVKKEAAPKAEAPSKKAPRPRKSSRAVEKLMAQNPPTIPQQSHAEGNGATMKRADQPALGPVVA